MALGNPIEAWLQMAQNKNQNTQQMNEDLAGIGQGVGGALGGIGQIIQQKKKQALMQQIVQAIKTQGAPQQGPPMPDQQGPQMPGQSFPPPSSGIGGPAQDNTQQMKGLLMQADPQGMMSQVENQLFKPGLNPLQMSEIAKNEALTRKLGMPPQAKPTNPLDDELKRVRILALHKLMNRQSQPKPVNPVPAEALDLRAQIANNQQAPWYKKLGFAGGLKPVKVNTTPGKPVSPSSVSDMSDEELLQLANQGDSNE